MSRGLLPVTVALLLNVSLAAFDTLAVNAALPDIGADLGDVGLLPWVITAFLFTSAVAVLVAGPLIDALGARAAFRVSTIVFVASSAACAVAPTLPVLVGARAVQGLGGGIAVAVSFACVGLAYPEHLTARAFAAESMVWGVVGFGGPPVVAGLVTLGGWHAVFVVNVPLGLVAIVAGWRRIPGRPAASAPTPLRLDPRGLALLTAFTFASLAGLSSLGRATVPWLLAGAGAVWLYARHARGRRDAVLQARHLRAAPFGQLHAVIGFTLAGALGAESYLPVFLRGGDGRSPGVAAFSVASLTVGWTIGSVWVSRLLDRLPAPTVVLRGTLTIVPAIGAAGLAVGVRAPLGVLLGAYTVMGVAIGVVATASFTELQHRAADDARGRVTAAHQYVRTLGITYGVAVAGAIVLFEVNRRTGSVAALRALLEGERGAGADARAADAIRAGYALAHAAAVVVAAGAVVPAYALVRGTRRRARAGAGTVAGATADRALSSGQVRAEPVDGADPRDL